MTWIRGTETRRCHWPPPAVVCSVPDTCLCLRTSTSGRKAGWPRRGDHTAVDTGGPSRVNTARARAASSSGRKVIASARRSCRTSCTTQVGGAGRASTSASAAGALQVEQGQQTVDVVRPLRLAVEELLDRSPYAACASTSAAGRTRSGTRWPRSSRCGRVRRRRVPATVPAARGSWRTP